MITGSVGSDIDKIRSSAPTTDPEYGIFLELGTSKMAKRPWLKPAFIKSKDKIKKIFKTANENIND